MPREDPPTDDYDFENESITVKCKYCQTEGLTVVGMQPSVLTFLLLIFSTMILGLVLSLFMFAPLMLLSGLKVHKCRQCNNVLGKSKKILNQVEFLEDKVHSVSIGELAFVISRRLIINILISLLLLMFFVWRLVRIDPVMGTPVDTTWEKFQKECGNLPFRERKSDQMGLISQCQYQYIGSTFQNWKGNVIKLNDNRSNYFDFFHSLKILLKMDPEDNPNSVDLILDVNFDKAKALTETLEKISRGQGIIFNATLKGIHVGSPNRLHLVDLQVSDDYKEIPEIVISNSRFDVEKTKQKLFVSKKNTEGSSEN